MTRVVILPRLKGGACGSSRVNCGRGMHLLEAAGFTQLDVRGLTLSACSPGMDPEDGVSVTVHDRDTGTKPDEDTKTYVVAAQAGRNAGRKEVVLVTSDARDVMAFSVSCRNDFLTRSGDYGSIPDEDCLISGHTCVTNPFTDPVRGDWILEGVSTPWEVFLAHPSRTYGDAYTLWRDERAAAMVAPGVSPSARR